MLSADCDHFLQVAFKENLSPENTNDDMDIGKKDLVSVFVFIV